MKRLLTGVLVALAVLAASGLVGWTTAASAQGTPDRFTFDFTDSFVDPDTCAAAPWQFDISATEHRYGFVEVFYDANGDFLRAIIHETIEFAISANDITLNERDVINVFIDADGRREVGLLTHILGPGGLVLRDAGQLVFDADGNFLYARGPHPQFFGASFCDALVPH